jgi:hypothetical protein
MTFEELPAEVKPLALVYNMGMALSHRRGQYVWNL